MAVTIREAKPEEAKEVVRVESEAFGGDQEIFTLVTDLLTDPTAEPRLSLLAFEGDEAIGHVFFTRAPIDAENEISAAILAPLAIVPARQKQGVGGKLIAEGLKRLTKSGTDLVFVLGYPSYYPRHGFRPAGVLGLDAPYPILEKNADAWMVQELRPGVLGAVKGTVRCAETMARPEYWLE